jgi:hypothetical protein
MHSLIFFFLDLTGSDELVKFTPLNSERQARGDILALTRVYIDYSVLVLTIVNTVVRGILRISIQLMRSQVTELS